MRKFFLLLGFVLLVALVQASPPPGEKVDFDLCEVTPVVNVDNTFVSIELQTAVVWEVAHRPLYSLPVTVNKSPAIEISQELTAYITTTNNDVVLKLPLSLMTMNVVTKLDEFQKPLKVYCTGGVIMNGNSLEINTSLNRTFQRNTRNCNYGYPLSANEQHGNLFFS